MVQILVKIWSINWSKNGKDLPNKNHGQNMAHKLVKIWEKYGP